MPEYQCCLGPHSFQCSVCIPNDISEHERIRGMRGVKNKRGYFLQLLLLFFVVPILCFVAIQLHNDFAVTSRMFKDVSDAAAETFPFLVLQDNNTTTTTTMTSNIREKALTTPPDDEAGIPKCFVNLHIPKVGGRTVGRFLKQVFETELNFTRYGHYGFPSDEMWPSNDTDRIFVQGHFSTKIFQEFPELQKCFAMTVLRQPVDRAISAFFYHQHRPVQLDYCLSEELKKSIRCRNYWQYSNDMTLRLVGPWEMHWKSANVGSQAKGNQKESSGATKNKTDPRSQSMGRKNNNITLQRPSNAKRERQNSTLVGVPRMKKNDLVTAKQNMQRYFDVVCFLTDLPSCARQILTAFQVDPSKVDLSIMTENKDNEYKTRKRPNHLEPDEMRKFQEANLLDMELYNWSLATFAV